MMTSRSKLGAALGLLVCLLLGGTSKNVYNTGLTSNGVVRGGGVHPTPQNIVVIVLDDWGLDQSTLYDATSPALTPNINTLAGTGIVYTRAVTAPACSPARSAALTGLYPHTNGVGDAINTADPLAEKGLNTALPTVMDVLHAHGYYNLAIGKSHMAGTEYFNDLLATHMHELGFDYWEGVPTGAVASYTSYSWVEDDNSISTKTAYATQYIEERAVAKLPANGPFFMWLAFNAPHGPFHCPPDAETPTYDAVCTPIGGETANEAKFHAALEAVDARLNLFVASLNPANTTVMILGDNGTVNTVCRQYANTKCKDTAYIGGVGVPLIAFGNKVTVTGTSAARINAPDFARTILEIAGINATELAAPDSTSFYSTFANTALSPRTINFAEGFTPNGGGPPDPTAHIRSAGDARYHLVKLANGTEELYDLQVDPWEATPLNLGALTAGESAAYTLLKNKIMFP